MAIRPIVRFGSAVLHRRSDAVACVDEQIVSLVQDMTETMYAAPGIGLAAPQIGVPLRVIVIDLSVGKDSSQLIQLINPELVEAQGSQRLEEGCLSIPGFEGAPVRPAKVVVRGTGLDGRDRELEAVGLLARAFSHEIDHIEGRLFVERLPPLKRSLALRRLHRRSREQGWAT
jgi:peptide deformylase